MSVLTDAINDLRAELKGQPGLAYGTVQSVDGYTAEVIIDGSTIETPADRLCTCSAGDRVLCAIFGNKCAAVSVVGGDSGGGGSSINPYSSNPEMDGTASPGTATNYSRGDHVHPHDTSKADTASLATVATSGAYADLTGRPTIPAAGIPSGGSTGQVLTKDSGTDYDVSWQTPSGGSLEYSFVTEQVKVIDSQSVASAGYYLNTETATKAGYYPVGVVGWTSSNQYPTVYACRLSSQSLGSCEITCGAANYTGSARTFNVWATVLWVAQTSLSDANGEDF